MIFFIGLSVGFLVCIILMFILGINHITRIIGVIIGAIAYYVLFYNGGMPPLKSDIIEGIISGFSVSIIYAVIYVLWEVFAFIGFVAELLGVDTSSEPSPYSHAMGGLASWLSSFFR